MNIDIKQYDKPVVVEPKAIHQHSVIWLHGLGADGNDFVNIIPMLGLEALGVRFIFPQAKVAAVTINGGMQMRSWYDIKSPDFSKRGDEAGINQSVQYVTQLIQNEVALGVALDKIILAGFSQGGAIALQASCGFSGELAGTIAMSCYLPLKDKITQPKQNLEIFMAHGTQDPVVPFMEGQKSFKYLQDLGFKIQFKDYNIQHSVSELEIMDISKFILSVFNV